MQSARVGDYIVYYRNPEEFRILKREVFSRNDYYVEVESERPLIVDVGACIGDTTLYYKRLYPQARIIAVEPLAENLEILEKNVTENSLESVEIVPAALAAKSGKLTLHVDASGYDWFTTVSVYEAGWDGRQKTVPREVRSVTLQELVPTGNIDILKLDIEGMEGGVLRGISSMMGRIKNIVVELHPRGGKVDPEVMKLLIKHGYELEVRVEGKEVDSKAEITELAILTAVKN